MTNNLVLFVLCASVLTAVVDGGNVLGCYYESWAIYREGIGEFLTSNIDPSLCTHIYYSFLGLSNTTQAPITIDTYVSVDKAGYQNFTNLKKSNTGVKFLISIGGWNEGSYSYSVLAQNATKRARFIEQIVDFIDEHGLDGLDFDWEYPTQRDSLHGTLDKNNFITLLTEVKAAFEPLGLLLTVSVGVDTDLIDVAYEVEGLSSVADLINFRAYDLHSTSESVTGINAPLHDPAGSVSVELFVNSWLNAGVDPQKLVLGIPFYGKLYTLSDSSKNSIGAPASGPGIAGPYLKDASNLAYYEILEKIQQGWTVVYDDDYESPYAYSGNQWVGYDNEKSIAAKIKFACSKSLGGIMTWSITKDDFGGHFGSKYPLLNAINAIKQC